MNTPLKSALQSFLDRLCNDAYAGTMFEGDADTLRDAISYIDLNERSKASAQDDVAAVRDAALEEAARLIETTRETTSVIGGGETERSLTARKVPDHDLTGRTWAKGIRALKSAAPTNKDKS